MNKSQRIYLNTGDTGNQNQDKFIKVKLEQDIETLEFMSLKIGTADAYQNFNADYGVLVGKVIANDGIGIPNAKISIFLPLEEEDSLDSDIYSIYPYDTPRTKNNEGKRYNLLPRVAKKDPNSGLIRPKQPFGSFPTKEEVLSNDPMLKVYKKYYKYTAKTNSYGDYMIFGVPIGTQTVHMSVDITDIGIYSMTPLSMVSNLGYSENLFSPDKTRIKPATDLDDLLNIETQEIAVNIIPFWGNTETFEIGISRQDFRIRAQLVNTFTIFGSAFTDNADSMWTANQDDNRNKARELYRIYNTKYLGIVTHRPAKVTETIYYYPNNISDEEIDNGTKGAADMKILDPEEYVRYYNEGNFVYLIKANRNKFIQDESGQDIPVSDDFNGGLYKDFRGFLTFEITEDDAEMNLNNVQIGSDPRPTNSDNYYVNPFRMRFKFPQHATPSQSFDNNDGIKTNAWRNETFTFESGKIYTVSKFHGTTKNSNDDNRDQDLNTFQFVDPDVINQLNLDPNWNVGVIATNDEIGEGNTEMNFPFNGKNNNGKINLFGANWLNFSIHFSQIGYSDESGKQGSFAGMFSNTNFSSIFKDNKHFYEDNNQLIGADKKNTKWYGRSDLHWTDFVEVSKDIIIGLFEETNIVKGFKSTQLSNELETKINNSNFRNGKHIPFGWSKPCPTYGGRIDGIPSNDRDGKYYFYKGLGEIDCIEYLISLGLV